VVMHFGIPNALNVFQHFMNDIFHEYLDYFMVCSINDIVIFSNNMKEDEWHVQLVWTSSRKFNFTLSWKNVNSIKPKWNLSSMKFLKMAFTWTLVRSKPDAPPTPWWIQLWVQRVETMERQGVRICSLVRSILGVKGHVGALGWGLGKSEKKINYSHKPAQTKQ
jgi:hypothetical protein